MFTPEEREQVRARLLELAAGDERIVAGALTGSFAGGTTDAWSDVDLAFALADGTSMDALLRDWTELVDSEFGTLHHWDLPFGGSVYRVFLLPGGLEVDLAFVPQAEYGPRGPRFHTVFGEAGEPREAIEPDRRYLAGLGWHHLLHARACIERGKPWQAEFLISAARDHVLALACIRLGESAAFARGIDQLPQHVTAPLEGSLVRSLAAEELRRALRVVADAYLAEVDPELGSAIEPVLREHSPRAAPGAPAAQRSSPA